MIDVKNTPEPDWQSLSPEDKKKELYKKQKATLDMFLERGAISQAQYDKSLGDLTEKMGMQDYKVECMAPPAEISHR